MKSIARIDGECCQPPSPSSFAQHASEDKRLRRSRCGSVASTNSNLNPETDAPTAMWLSVRAKENIRIFAWIIMLVFGMGMIVGGIKGAMSVLFRDGIFSRWWIGALIAFGGLKLMQYLAVKLKASSTRKRRKKRKGK